MTTPFGDDADTIAVDVIERHAGKRPGLYGLRLAFARALQQYGAKRATEAREAAIERCAEWHDLLAEQISNLLAEQISTAPPNEGREERLWIERNWHREMAKAFRSGGALAAKPGSKI